MQQRTWLQLNIVAARLAAQAGLTPLNREICANMIRGYDEILVEPHIPRSSRYSAFVGGCTWADDPNDSIKPGDRVVITSDFMTYYIMTVMP